MAKDSSPAEGGNRSGGNFGERGDIGEIIDLVKTYAKQETVGPFRNTGRYLARGLAGAFLMAIGLILLSIAGLRAMQTETHAFDHGWSWAPYLIMVATTGLIASFFVLRIVKGEPDA